MARVTPNRIPHRELEVVPPGRAHELDFGPGATGDLTDLEVFEVSRQSDLPTRLSPRRRSHHHLAGFEAEDRPETDPESTGSVALIGFGRGVEGEEESSRVLEAHAAAVVAAHDPVDSVAPFDREINPTGAGIT